MSDNIKTNNLITPKITLNSKEINNIDDVSGDTSADNKTIYTKKKVDTIISDLSADVISNTNKISSLENSKNTFYSFYDVFDKTTLRDFETVIMGKVRLRTYKNASPYDLTGAVIVKALIKIRSGRYNSIYDYMITSDHANGMMSSGDNCYCYKLSFCCNFKKLTSTNVITCIDGIYVNPNHAFDDSFYGNDIKFVSYSQLKPTTNEEGIAPPFFI